VEIKNEITKQDENAGSRADISTDPGSGANNALATGAGRNIHEKIAIALYGPPQPIAPNGAFAAL
jgi:hypothetical protein